MEGTTFKLQNCPTPGVERVCDLVNANQVGASPKVEQSIRSTVDKVAAIGLFTLIL